MAESLKKMSLIMMPSTTEYQTSNVEGTKSTNRIRHKI